jgi:amino acid adenylation domain-containing protein
MTPDALLQEIVTAQAHRWPEAPAIAWRHNVLRYRDVEDRSNQLARALRDAGCRRGDRVCLMLPRGPEAVIATLAVLKADGVVVPLDIAGAASRLATIVRLCEPRCVLTVSSGAGLLDQVFLSGVPGERIAIGSLGSSPIVGEQFATRFCARDLELLPTRPLTYKSRTASPAQIVFSTSSREMPRGVVLTHANVRRLIVWANDYFGVMPGDRHSWQSPLGDGISVYAALGTLAAGACIHPTPSDFGVHAVRLAEAVRDAELTMWMVPGQAMLEPGDVEGLRPGGFQHLRHVIWQGQSLSASAVRQWMARLRHTSFTRLYGTTEASVATCYHRVSRAATSDLSVLPIGRPRSGEQAVVLDEERRPTDRSQTGEIFVGGLGLSPGYWRDPEATAAAFVRPIDAVGLTDRVVRTGDLGRVDSDGQIYVTGRRDRRVSTDVEFGEIEAALRRLGSVRAAAVVAVRGGEGGAPVVGCAYVPVPGIEVTSAELREGLASMLPASLLPTRWQEFRELPRVADGTIDSDEIRRSLSVTATATQ